MLYSPSGTLLMSQVKLQLVPAPVARPRMPSSTDQATPLGVADVVAVKVTDVVEDEVIATPELLVRLATAGASAVPFPERSVVCE